MFKTVVLSHQNAAKNALHEQKRQQKAAAVLQHWLML